VIFPFAGFADSRHHRTTAIYAGQQFNQRFYCLAMDCETSGSIYGRYGSRDAIVHIKTGPCKHTIDPSTGNEYVYGKADKRLVEEALQQAYSPADARSSLLTQAAPGQLQSGNRSNIPSKSTARQDKHRLQEEQRHGPHILFNAMCNAVELQQQDKAAALTNHRSHFGLVASFSTIPFCMVLVREGMETLHNCSCMI
jgi:hypothetical protein